MKMSLARLSACNSLEVEGGASLPAVDKILRYLESGSLLSVLFLHDVNYVVPCQGWLMAEESVS